MFTDRNTHSCTQADNHVQTDAYPYTCTPMHSHGVLYLYTYTYMHRHMQHAHAHTYMYTHVLPHISVPAYTGVHTGIHTCIHMHTHGSRRVNFGVLYKCTHACKFKRKQSPASQCLRKHMVPLNSHTVCPSLQAQGARVWQTCSVSCCSSPCRSTPTWSRSSGLPSYSCILREVWPACGPGSILLNLPSCSKFVSGRDA